MYREGKDELTDNLFENFSNLRNAYKRFLFKSNKNMYELYSQSGIENITLKIENPFSSKDAFLCFNPDSRVFEFYEEGDNEPRFSLPVSKVMKKDRNEFYPEVDITPILSRDKRMDRRKLKVKNLDEINREIQKNIYSFKEDVYKEKNISIKNRERIV